MSDHYHIPPECKQRALQDTFKPSYVKKLGFFHITLPYMCAPRAKSSIFFSLVMHEGLSRHRQGLPDTLRVARHELLMVTKEKWLKKVHFPGKK